MNSEHTIAIIYLVYYHNESYIDDAVSALKKMTYPKDKVALVFVVNSHERYGSFVRYVEETVLPLSQKELPKVVVLPQEKNLGFGPGNNAGTRWALEHGYDFVLYHNNDGFFAVNALEPLVEAFVNDPRIGAAQSLMLLHPETHLLNSAGNSFQYLGFGFCDQYRTPVTKLSLPPIKEVGYASGAAFMVRSDLVREYGAWDEDFFMYHEDLEWALRLRSVGYKIMLVSDSIFYHKYQFGRSMEKFYWMERNRYGTMLIFFRRRTLLLLLPMALLMELGLWFFALKNGSARQRIAVYRYWLSVTHWQQWLAKRRRMQKIRTVSDRYLLSFSVPDISFQDASVNNPILRYIGNPIMTVYYWIVVKGLIWW